MLRWSRKIIHIDMDAFFASVEIRDHPELQNQPVAVGGSADARGVIATCNYIARRYGVRSAMSSAKALRCCPALKLLPGRMAVYRAISTQLQAIFSQYTQQIERVSLDEAYLDVSHCHQYKGSATWMAQAIRRNIYQATGLTASAGVAGNKFLAKIASEQNKPNGQYVITPDHAAEFARNLPLRKIPGVGPKTAERMAKRGLYTGHDILQHTPEALQSWLGKFGPILHQRAQGIDDRMVQGNRKRQSVGLETTLSCDLGTYGACQTELHHLLPEFRSRLGHHDFDTLQVKLKFHDFSSTTAAQKSQHLDRRLLDALLQVAYQRGQGRGVRLVGLSATLADEDNREQMPLRFV